MTETGERELPRVSFVPLHTSARTYVSFLVNGNLIASSEFLYKEASPSLYPTLEILLSKSAPLHRPPPHRRRCCLAVTIAFTVTIAFVVTRACASHCCLAVTNAFAAPPPPRRPSNNGSLPTFIGRHPRPYRPIRSRIAQIVSALLDPRKRCLSQQ